jgi:CDP-diacylglycerol---glycerol-3-phosphate 3-phosphatidyltransferase
LILAGTSLRIVATPVVMALVISRSWTAAAVVFVFAASTDWFDGRFARRWNVSSRLGSFLDTTADKLLVTGVLVALVAVGRASPWVSMVIIGRELSLLGLRGAVATQGGHLEPSLLGKAKATTQFVALALVMLRPDVVIAGAYLDQWLLAIAALVSVWSGIDYFVRFSSALRDAD